MYLCRVFYFVYLCHVSCFVCPERTVSARTDKYMKYNTKYNKKNRDLELRHMFLGQIFAKNAKNDPKTLF